MAFDPNSLVASRSDWLDLPVQYVGRGRATFSRPEGVLEGPSTVTFARNGEGRVRIIPERGMGEGQWPFPLFHGSMTGEFRQHGFSNPCRSVEVITDQGRFTSTDRVRVTGRVVTNRPEFPIQLSTLRAEFEADGDRQAAFWALPLSNFVTDDWPWPSILPADLANHPLRIYPTPHVPMVLDGTDLTQALMLAARQDRLIAFLQRSGTGFLERLPGYERRVRRLRRLQRPNQFTAVAVGPAHVQHVRWDEPDGLFPIDLHALLTLATGTSVGAPWVEFRDAEGRLVRRCHIPFGAPRYERRHPTIHGFGWGFIGQLLTTAFSCPDFGKRHLRVVLHHAIAAGETGTMESRFVSLCRAFETLCRESGVKNHYLTRLVSEPTQTEVNEILKATEQKLRALQPDEPTGDGRTALHRIAERVRTAGQQDKLFGLAVSELVKTHQLHDADVLDKYFREHPTSFGGTAWAAVLTHYRTAATHDAYFDIGGKHDLWAISRVMDHLHDVLLRVIFKTIGYDGPYHTPIPPGGPRDNADWVRPETHPSRLGFPVG